MNFDARDVDLPTREQEGVGGGAALEINATAVLAGPGLGHGGSVAHERRLCRDFWRALAGCGTRTRNPDSGGFFYGREGGGRGVSGPGRKGGLGPLHDGVEGIAFLQVRGAKETEENGVRVSAWDRAALLADFAGVHGDPHLLLGMVVIRTDARVIEEGQHLMTVATQPFDETLGVGISPREGDELI